MSGLSQKKTKDEIKEILDGIIMDATKLRDDNDMLNEIDIYNQIYLMNSQSNLAIVFNAIKKKKLEKVNKNKSVDGKRQAWLEERRGSEFDRINRRDRSVTYARSICDASPETTVRITEKFVEDEKKYYTTTTDRDGNKIEITNSNAMFEDLRNALKGTSDLTDKAPTRRDTEDISPEISEELKKKAFELAGTNVEEEMRKLAEQEEALIKDMEEINIPVRYKSSVAPKARKGRKGSPGLSAAKQQSSGVSPTGRSRNPVRGGSKLKKKRRNSKSPKRRRSKSPKRRRSKSKKGRSKSPKRRRSKK